MRTLICPIIGLVLAAMPAIAHEVSDRDTIQLMTKAAEFFVKSLTEEQRAKALFAMDHEERLNLRTTPFPVGGVKFGEMTPGQVDLVHTMLNAALSATGYHKAASIMALEEYMVELGRRNQGRPDNIHGRDRYSVAVFDSPVEGGTWAWRIHGHHLYLEFTVADGKLYAGGPAFMGAEPHDVTEGPRAGWRVLAAEEDLGRAVMESLTAEQRATATIAAEMPRDMFSGMERELDVMGPPKGVAFKDLTADQQAKLRALVMEYVNNIPADVRSTRLAQVEKGGWDNIHFAWIGSLERGERMYYRVHSAGFLIEYCAVALSDNHVHTVWRDPAGDFGRDILGEHMSSNPH